MKKLLFLILLFVTSITCYSQCPTTINCNDTNFIFHYNYLPPYCNIIEIKIDNYKYNLNVLNYNYNNKTITTNKNVLNCNNIADRIKYKKNGKYVGNECESCYGIALPVTWISCNIYNNIENTTTIEWLVQEENNSHFQIQILNKYFNKWDSIININSKDGNSLNEYKYEFTKAVGKNYYRIIQTDIDGKTSSSRILFIDNGITLFDNPKYDILGRRIND